MPLTPSASLLRRLAPLLLGILLVWVAGASGVRLWSLATEGWQPRAPGEERWLEWGGGNAWERTVLAKLPDRPPAPRGSDFRLRIETSGPVRAEWVHVQAQYRWPAHRVVDTRVARPGDSPAAPQTPPATPVLEIPVEAPLPELTETATRGGARRMGPFDPGSEGGRGDPKPYLLGLSLLVCALVAGRALLGAPWRGSSAHPSGTPTLSSLLARNLSSLVVGLGLLAAGTLVVAHLLPHRVPAPRLAAPLVAGLSLLVTGLALGLWTSRRRGRGPTHGVESQTATPEAPAPGSLGLRTVTRLADLVVILAILVFVVQTFTAPLWSWDHFAIWGMKARRLAALGAETGLFDSPAFRWSAGHYPLAWPALVWCLAPGAVPGPELFRALHLGAGLALVLLLRSGLRTLGVSPLAAATAAALVAASPLLWDSESLGLADLPLALLATSAVLLGLGALRSRRAGHRRRLLLATGLAAGLAPWLKQEGWLLAAAIVLSWMLARWTSRLPPPPAESPEDRREDALRPRAGSLPWLLAPALVLAAFQPFSHRALGGPGVSFLAGDWPGRLTERLAASPEIFASLATVLLHPAWHGLWLAFAIALVAALVVRLLPIPPMPVPRSPRLPRPGPALLPVSVTLLQLAGYAAVYLATYLPPDQHVDSSFLRIAGALGPLAVVAAAWILAGPVPVAISTAAVRPGHPEAGANP